MSRLLIFTALLMLLPLGACRSTGPGKIPDAPPPGYATVASVYNDRVEPIDTLWARATVRVIGEDADGDRFSEQGEGHLQLQRPSSVSLTIGKLGETHLAFGSGDDSYWWFDLIDSEDRVLVTGRHSEYERAKGRLLGSPVHPLELLDGVGITPLPETAPSTPVAWAPDGASVVVETRQGSGWRRMTLDPVTGEPSEITLLDSFKTPIVEIRLESYETAPKSGDTSVTVRLPSRVEIYRLTPDGSIDESSMVRMELFDAKIRPIREIVFDLERLARAYRVGRVIDLDAPPSQPESGG